MYNHRGKSRQGRWQPRAKPEVYRPLPIQPPLAIKNKGTIDSGMTKTITKSFKINAATAEVISSLPLKLSEVLSALKLAGYQAVFQYYKFMEVEVFCIGGGSGDKDSLITVFPDRDAVVPATVADAMDVSGGYTFNTRALVSGPIFCGKSRPMYLSTEGFLISKKMLTSDADKIWRSFAVAIDGAAQDFYKFEMRIKVRFSGA